nr:hypothetical protein [Erythrotrichia carnea]
MRKRSGYYCLFLKFYIGKQHNKFHLCSQPSNYALLQQLFFYNYGASVFFTYWIVVVNTFARSISPRSLYHKDIVVLNYKLYYYYLCFFQVDINITFSCVYLLNSEFTYNLKGLRYNPDDENILYWQKYIF